MRNSGGSYEYLKPPLARCRILPVPPGPSSVVAVVPGGRAVASRGRTLTVVNGGGRGEFAAWPVRGAHPTGEYEEQLHEDEGDKQQGQRVRVPVHVVRAVPRPWAEVHLRADVALLGLELELVLNPDLLEHHLLGPVRVDATPAPTSIGFGKKKKNQISKTGQVNVFFLLKLITKLTKNHLTNLRVKN